MPDTPNDDNLINGAFRAAELRPDGLPAGYRCTTVGVEYEVEEEDEESGEKVRT